MIMNFSQGNQEGLNPLRFILALSSFSPLFVLWAARGVAILPDIYFIPVCLFFAIVPSSFLFVREKFAKRDRDTHTLTVGKVENHSGHFLVYLFAMLLPFYSQDIEGWRDLSALLFALAIIVFLFWHLNFYYINILFAIRGYHILTVHSPRQENQHANLDSFILITRRSDLLPEQDIVGLRLSNTVYIEESNDY